ncbi:hydroxymethylglutaryl-CoA reductase [Fructobacillus parabroussonetiae]|uniref:Hydroxymethylglutaryl-CoA reductase n=1 Tax=Fructobacillus parabroussonetiae TaxID=2713174 RepID=A0ABS5QWM1_9LACO|nr:hydroxymethylglutaryl-CoA reductase [Fructobacillus parabroussonetiae]MBS9336965.1 hydroxymethylglutaryl-CoA reductase [Fructobacillus parabroussonetiae]
MTKKFYQLTAEERLNQLNLSAEDRAFFFEHQGKESAHLIENYLADFALPEGLLPALLLDGQKSMIPMVTEEPSVVAAASNGARMAALGSGFFSEKASQARLTGQILFHDVDQKLLAKRIEESKSRLFAIAKAAKPSMVARGNGLKSVAYRVLDVRHSVLELSVDTGKAMGANAVNTILEAVKGDFDDLKEQIAGAILSNAGQEALVSVSTKVPVDAVGGLKQAEKIVALAEFGQVDVDRAVTENKGIFNGISSVVLATGNDFRAVEAAGHAYAARHGAYRSLSSWALTDDQKYLAGQLTMPLNIGLLGGAMAALPMASKNLLLMGQPDLDRLKKLILATGLANNLAALKAVSGKGIQAGHMKMQARTLAIQAGAQEDEIAKVASRLAHETTFDQAKAERILGEIRTHDA